MSGDVSNNVAQTIELDKYKLLNLTADEKEKYVDNMIIIYPLMKQILSEIEECKNSSHRLGEVNSMFLSGDSRYGKSVITKVFMRKYPDIIAEDYIS